MLHLAKSAELGSTVHQLTLIWNQLAVNLRRDIPEPRPTITLSQFIDQVDSKTAIWTELAMRQRPALPSSTPDRHTNTQRNQQVKHRYPYPPPQRIPVNDGKSYAYLVDIDPDGYGVYEEEGSSDQDHGPSS